MKFKFFSRNKAKQVPRRSLVLQSLEERILWDASMDLQDNAEDTNGSQEENAIVESATPTTADSGNNEGSAEQEATEESNEPAIELLSELDTQTEEDALSGDGTAEEPLSEQTDEEDTLTQSSENDDQNEEQRNITDVVVIDSSIADYESLVEDVKRSSGSETDVHIIDSAQSGVDQIEEILASYQELESLHIISHGDEGELFLGADTVTSENAGDYTDSFASWGDHFAEGGDILLYGCDVAGNANGEYLVEQIAQATGLDVAASTDNTGTENEGGDFDLEFVLGDVETAVAVTESADNLWSGILTADPEGTVTVPDEAMIDVDTFSVELSFDNIGPDVGYVPFGDLVVGPGADVDSASFTFLGNPLTAPNPPAAIATWNGSQWIDADGDPVATHPLQRANDNVGTGEDMLPPSSSDITLEVGSVWYTVEFPFGSFTAANPQIVSIGDVEFNDDAVVGEPIDFFWRPSFTLGDMPDNSAEPEVGDWNNDQITPTVIQITKTNDLAEGETVSGPNFPVTYTLEVEIAGGESIDDVILTDYLPNNAIYRGDVQITANAGGAIPDVSVLAEVYLTDDGGATQYDANLFRGPLNDLQLVIDFGDVDNTANLASFETVDYTITYTAYFPFQDADSADLIPLAGTTNSDDSLNEATVNGIYNGNPVADTQDNDSAGPDGAVDDGDDLVEVHGLATQKSFENITTPDGLDRPNDILRWTVEFQVSDYFAFDDVVITDLLGDGMRLIAHAGGSLPPPDANTGLSRSRIIYLRFESIR